MIILLLILTTLPGIVSVEQLEPDKPQQTRVGNNILYVGGTGPGNYSMIQDAINDASFGSTVFVYAGTYDESLIINKSLNLTGENRDTTIIDGNWKYLNIIELNASWVNISGFTLSRGVIGISLKSVSNNTILNNNIFSHKWYGVYLYSSSNNWIGGNNFSDNSVGVKIEQTNPDTYYHTGITFNNFSKNEVGMEITQSSNIKVDYNNFTLNEMNGLLIDSSEEIYLDSNEFFYDGMYIKGNRLPHYNTHHVTASNRVNGKILHYFHNQEKYNFDSSSIGQLILANCSEFKFKWQELKNTDVGILAAYSDNIEIRYSKIAFNKWDGIQCYKSTNITIVANNIFSNHNWGINFQQTTNSSINDNEVLGNYQGGIKLYHRSNYNNISNNKIKNNQEGLYLLKNNENNTIAYNNFTMNDNGSVFNESSNNIFKNNNISQHLYNGLSFYSSSHNLIYNNNFFLTKIQIKEEDSNNYWNEIYPIGGNYWSEHSPYCRDLYNGSSTPQTTGSPDGICDFQYNISSNSVDYYPLKLPWDYNASANDTKINRTLYVGGSGPGNYTSIQMAINDAISGGIIFVYNGTYYGSIEIDKSISLVGEDKNNTIIDGNYYDVISVKEGNVTIRGFTIIDCDYPTHGGFYGLSPNYYAGVTLKGVYNCTIIDNNISSDNGYGLHLESAFNITIANNIITNNWGAGIYLKDSVNITINDNNIFNNNAWGIYSSDSPNITINNNFLKNNLGLGIYGSSYNWISQNNFINNRRQAYVSSSFSGMHNEWDSCHWSDFRGVDVDPQNGAGDTPYYIKEEGADHSPIMSPFKFNNIEFGYDTDNDVLPDLWEDKYGFDPSDPNNADEDYDQDSLLNIEEFILKTDPTNPDTDGDGITDGDEIAQGTDPLVEDKPEKVDEDKDKPSIILEYSIIIFFILAIIILISLIIIHISKSKKSN